MAQQIKTGFNLNGEVIGEMALSTEEDIECPFCHKQIETQPLTYFIGKETQIFLKCKRCRNSFIGYSESRPDGQQHIIKLSKGNPKTKEFPQEIKDTSEGFVKIYGESELAEQENLMEICGVGYRKALEYLIKDYLIERGEESEPRVTGLDASIDEPAIEEAAGEATAKESFEDKVKKNTLGYCIREMVNNPQIKEIARRAVWLGNDETHYVKKWEEKDLQDLKKLIEITVHFIAMAIQSKKYIEEMESTS